MPGYVWPPPPSLTSGGGIWLGQSVKFELNASVSGPVGSILDLTYASSLKAPIAWTEKMPCPLGGTFIRRISDNPFEIKLIMTEQFNLKDVPYVFSRPIKLSLVSFAKYGDAYCSPEPLLVKAITFKVTSCEPTGSPSSGSSCACRIIEQ